MYTETRMRLRGSEPAGNTGSENDARSVQRDVDAKRVAVLSEIPRQTCVANISERLGLRGRSDRSSESGR